MTSSDLNLKKYGDTSFITGLRAYAVFAVIMIHCGGAGLRDFGQIGNNIADWGKTGVYMFFVISGFAITASFYKEKTIGRFYLKRLVRIIPLYYGVMFLAYFIWNHNEISLLLHLLFVNWLHPDYANDMLSVEWSIPIEIFFYALFPFLLRNADLKRMAVLSILALGLFFFLHYAVQFGITKQVLPDDAKLRYHFSPFQHFFPFFLGSLAYFTRERFYALPRMQRELLFLAACAIVAQIWLIGYGPEMVLVSVSTFLIILSGGRENRFTTLLMDNRPVLFLGKISYSLYLTHITAISLAQEWWPASPFHTFISASVLAIGISTLTYFIIETPPQKWAKRWMQGR